MFRLLQRSTRFAQHRNRRPRSSAAGEAASKLTNFDELIVRRRDEAARTILVQVNSDKSYAELHRYCRQYGPIVGAHHYAHEDQHYIAVEYERPDAAQQAVRSGTHNDECAGGAAVVQSPFLWFRAGPKARLNPAAKSDAPSPPPLRIVDGNRHIDQPALSESLRQLASVDEQMIALHSATCLNDVGTRLRFLAARQIEQSLHGMFPHATAYPFGSSVNGFGRLGCDLDLILRLGMDDDGDAATAAESRLVYHTKEHLSNGRSQTQRQMETISDVMQLFLPGVCHVRRILQARVPIIKYRHDHLDLEVDLSMSNLTGVYMSELLYMFGQHDRRVMPLIFTVRRWAQSVGLTNASPGRWISNFSLTCLVVFYLQQKPAPAILPSVNELIAGARRPADVRITEDGINCTFLRDLQTLQSLNATGDERAPASLAELLAGFFEFYAQMDFAERAISLNEGRTCPKPDHSPVYIVNPLEVQLNVSKNMSSEECERFRIEVRNAAWALDSFADAASANGGDWGILSIMRSTANGANGQPATPVIRPSMFFKPRMVDVSDLFGGGEAPTSQTARSTPVAAIPVNRFKNDTVRGMVDKIQRKGRADLQQMDARLAKGDAFATSARNRKR